MGGAGGRLGAEVAFDSTGAAAATEGAAAGATFCSSPSGQGLRPGFGFGGSAAGAAGGGAALAASPTGHRPRPPLAAGGTSAAGAAAAGAALAVSAPTSATVAGSLWVRAIGTTLALPKPPTSRELFPCGGAPPARGARRAEVIGAGAAPAAAPARALVASGSSGTFPNPTSNRWLVGAGGRSPPARRDCASSTGRFSSTSARVACRGGAGSSGSSMLRYLFGKRRHESPSPNHDVEPRRVSTLMGGRRGTRCDPMRRRHGRRRAARSLMSRSYHHLRAPRPPPRRPRRSAALGPCRQTQSACRPSAAGPTPRSLALPSASARAACLRARRGPSTARSKAVAVACTPTAMGRPSTPMRRTRPGSRWRAGSRAATARCGGGASGRPPRRRRRRRRRRPGWVVARSAAHPTRSRAHRPPAPARARALAGPRESPWPQPRAAARPPLQRQQRPRRRLPPSPCVPLCVWEIMAWDE